MTSFLSRIGGVLVAPRPTLRSLVRGRGDALDIFVLLLLRALAGEPGRLVAAALGARVFGFVGAMQQLLTVVRAVVPEALAIALAAVVLGLVAHKSRRARALEVAAYAWLPFLAVMLADALIHTGLGRDATTLEHFAAQCIGIGWSLGVLLFGAFALRADEGKSLDNAPVMAPPESARVAGIGVVGGLVVLLGLGVFAAARRPEAVLPVGVRGPSPDFRLPLLGGGEFHLKEGKPVLIDFWATWCAPCRIELPIVNRVAKRFGDRVRFVAVDIESREAEPAVAKFAAENGIEIPLALGGDTTADEWKVETVPHLVLLDADGQVRKVIEGTRGEAGVASAVEDLLR